MAWTKDSIGGIKRMYNLDLDTTLDANGTALTNATAAYSDAIEVGKDVALGTISELQKLMMILAELLL